VTKYEVDNLRKGDIISFKWSEETTLHFKIVSIDVGNFSIEELETQVVSGQDHIAHEWRSNLFRDDYQVYQKADDEEEIL
jgi:hypothetical protein